MVDRRTDATGFAIELLTLWMESDRASAAAHIDQVVNDPEGLGAEQTVEGLLNLSMVLAFQLARESGVAPEDYMAWVGRRLREMSLQLPEPE